MSARIEALQRAPQQREEDHCRAGNCCLVPRENIRVTSIIDRFLEHTRILLFRNGGATEIYATSGDWMPRNFFRRIEVTWPILDPNLLERVELQILGTALADDAKSWRLHPDGTYRRRKRRAGASSSGHEMQRGGGEDRGDGAAEVRRRGRPAPTAAQTGERRLLNAVKRA